MSAICRISGSTWWKINTLEMNMFQINTVLCGNKTIILHYCTAVTRRKQQPLCKFQVPTILRTAVPCSMPSTTTNTFALVSAVRFLVSLQFRCWDLWSRFFTDYVPFLLPYQQRQSTVGIKGLNGYLEQNTCKTTDVMCTSRVDLIIFHLTTSSLTTSEWVSE